MSAAPSSNRQITALFAILFIAWCAALVWLQHLRLSAGVHYEYEDDALYLQMLHLVGDGLAPYNTIHPLHRPSHLTPAYFALWPLYRLFGGGWTAAFILKALLIGGAAIPVFQFARRRTQPHLALLLALTWLLCAPTLALVQSTLRPLTLAAAPLMAMLFSYADGRLRSTVLWSVIVLACREDLALTVILLSGLAILERRSWGWIALPGGIALLWLGLSTQVLLPLILPADYSSVVLTTNLSGGIPLLERLVEPSHIGAMLVVIVSFGLLPLRSRLTLVGGVGLASILLNRHVMTANLVHLAMPWVVAAFAGAISAAVDQNVKRRTALLLCCALGIHVQTVLPPTLHLAPTIQDASEVESIEAWSPLHPANFDQSPNDVQRLHAVALVPKEASVAAVGHFLPLLVPRSNVYEYGHGYVPFTVAEWALLEANAVTTGAGGHVALTKAELVKHLDLLHSAGWKTEQQIGGIYVLRRTSPAPAGLADRLRQLVNTRTAPNPQATTGTRTQSRNEPGSNGLQN